MIPYGRQDISEADIRAVVEALRSDWLTQGPAVPAFEKALAGRCGAQHAVAVNSGTSALHLACLALGVGPGDLVWTSAITFVASANCARYCGADVDFVDIDPRTWNMSVEALGRKLEAAQAAKRLPKVVIPVHLCGQPCDMQAIRQLGERYGFRIIEDASHALGATYRKDPVGSGRWSDITVLSFHPVKIITSGEGGAALANDPALAKRMQLLRTHGITREAQEMTHAPDGAWYYEQQELGLNYRLTDVHAALGLSQMSRLDEFLSARVAIAERYYELLKGLPVTVPYLGPLCTSAWHLYVVRVPKNRRAVYDKLRAAGIGVNLHYMPVYRQPYYERMGFDRSQFPQAERYYAEAITLPLYPRLTRTQQDEVAAALKKALA